MTYCTGHNAAGEEGLGRLGASPADSPRYLAAVPRLEDLDLIKAQVSAEHACSAALQIPNSGSPPPSVNTDMCVRSEGLDAIRGKENLCSNVLGLLECKKHVCAQKILQSINMQVRLEEAEAYVWGSTFVFFLFSYPFLLQYFVRGNLSSAVGLTRRQIRQGRSAVEFVAATSDVEPCSGGVLLSAPG